MKLKQPVVYLISHVKDFGDGPKHETEMHGYVYW